MYFKEKEDTNIDSEFDSNKGLGSTTPWFYNKDENKWISHLYSR